MTKIEQNLEETTDYDVFSRYHCNRLLSESHINELIDSISQKNLLNTHPILVDKNLHIIDGQHRLEAARRMGIPISYKIDESLDQEDMIRLNVNSKTWTVTDYLNFYSQRQNSDYVKLKNFIEKEKMQLNIALQLLNGSKNTSFFKKFKDGKYQFPSDNELAESLYKNLLIKDIISFIKKKTSGTKIYLDRVAFYGALVEFFNIKFFEYEKFKTKLEYNLGMMRPCTKQSQYILLFKDIYNWKNKNPLRDDYIESTQK